MTKLFRLCVAVAVLATSLPARAGDWYSNTVANPLAGTVIVDTGPLPVDTYYNWCVYWSSTVNATLRIEHRNAANNATLHEYTVFNLANTSASPFCSTVVQPPYLLQNERIRVVNTSLIALGNVSSSIILSQ